MSVATTAASRRPLSLFGGVLPQRAHHVRAELRLWQALGEVRDSMFNSKSSRVHDEAGDGRKRWRVARGAASDSEEKRRQRMLSVLQIGPIHKLGRSFTSWYTAACAGM
jgi:hypothetical protein